MFIEWIIWGAIMAFIFWLMAKSRQKDIKTNDRNELKSPLYVLIVGIIGTVFFVGFAVFSNVFPNFSTTVWTTSFFLGFGLASSVLIYSYYVQNHSYSETKISYTTFTAKKVELLWSDIKL